MKSCSILVEKPALTVQCSFFTNCAHNNRHKLAFIINIIIILSLFFCRANFLLCLFSLFFSFGFITVMLLFKFLISILGRIKVKKSTLIIANVRGYSWYEFHKTYLTLISSLRFYLFFACGSSIHSLFSL